MNAEPDFDYEEVADVDLSTGYKPRPRALLPRCPAKNGKHACYLIEHPGVPVHVDLSTGWLEVWSTPNDDTWKNVSQTPSDPLTDAPEALRD